MGQTRTFTYSGDRSDKFWRVTLSGNSLAVHFGRTGTEGQKQVKRFKLSSDASEAAGKLIAEKLRKGYVEAGKAGARAASAGGSKGASPGQLAAVPALRIVRWRRAARPITRPVTKFGGQPVWVDGPQWPLSRRFKWPMRFIGQIRLDPAVFGKTRAKMAYLFATHPEWPLYASYFETDPCFPDRGENAVILQPGGKTDLRIDDMLDRGPTLYTEAGMPCEYEVKLKPSKDPAFRSEREKRDEEFDGYFDAVYGDKVGGTPAFFQGDEWPDGTGAENWRLLLQLSLADREEFVLNIPSLLFAFINKDGTRGAMLSQH